MSSSGSPRSRVDQFFPSRKRTPALPKHVKSERAPKATVPVSPSAAKGTLDGYLVKSPDAGSQGDGRSTDRVIPLRPDPPVKRNLTLEVDLGFGPAPKDGAGTSVLENSVTGGTFGGVQGGLNAAAVESANSSSKILDVCNAVESDDGNSQLQKFATDFLSLYCSDLPSTASLTTEEILKGQKRNGSPSLLVVNDKACSKKQCMVPSRFLAEGGERETGQDSCENLNYEFGDKQMKKVTPLSIEIDENGGGTGVECDAKCLSFARLRRCNVTPNNDLNKVQRSAFGDVLGARQTPKSARKSFMTSPGDEFWDEAIQVADVLIPTDKLSDQFANDFSAQSKKKLDESCFIGSQRCSIKSLMDELAGDLSLQSDKKLSNLSNSDCVDNDGEWGGNCSKELENYAEETKLAAAHLTNKASPLPVKHFDFSNEEHNLQDNASSRSFVKSAGDIPPVQNSTSHLHVNMNDPQSSGAVACNESSINNLGSPRKTDVCNPKVACMTSMDSSKLVEVSNVCSTISPGDYINNQGDKNNISHSDMKDKLPNKGISSTNKEIEKDPVSHINSFEVMTPSSSIPLKDSLKLHNWLPPEICSIYTQKGISSLYPWQVDCLQIDGVLERRNLVYCASTSSGKSFVAEILMLRRVISTRKMAILVLPYVSICAEKADHLEALLEPLGKHVRSFYGNQGGRSLPKDTSVAVCTIEKANSLVNNLLEEGRLAEVGIIVIDELHMVGDQHRGYLLELLLTKLRYASGEGSSSSISGDSSGSSSGKYCLSQTLQVVGMSATMPNLSAVADWLQAALYQTDFRPVPLEEYIKVENNIFNKKLDIVRTISKTADLGGKDPDHIVELCDEIVQEGHSVLIFCSSRKGCESTARHISKFLRKFSIKTREFDSDLNDTLSVIEALRRCPAGLDPCLEETLPSGVAYHHAGLTVEEREIVETCYRRGLIRVLTATSTLAAGVNLPARRVIFRQPRIGWDFIDGTRYRQMAGRAGRTGIDTKGESILICKPEEVKRIISLLNDSCPPLESCLSDDKNGMIHAILEVVSGGIVQTATDIHRYVRCTLLNSTKPFQDVVKSAQDSLRWLCHKKFLEWNEETRLYNTTPLGLASFGSSLSPEESLIVLDDLSRAREGFVLASDLHLVYLVTPINIEMVPDWELYYERFMELSILDQSVGNRVGVTEPFLMRMAHGAPMHSFDRIRGMGKQKGRMQSMSDAVVNNCSLEHVVRVSKRFYVALMLSKLVQEVPISDVCSSFKVARGMIQSLQENAGRFASMVVVFCERLGWHDLEGLISKFQNRVSFGVRAEIVELTTIPYVKGSRARALYKFGLRSPLAIAEATTTEIAKALYESSSWAAQEDSAMHRLQLGVAKKIKNGARKIMLDKAEEARVAAFSTFQTLGIEVPQFFGTHLHDNIRAPALQVDAARPHTADGISCSRKEEFQISDRVSIEQVAAENVPPMAMEGKLARVSEILEDASPKLCLYGVYKNSPSSSNTNILAEAPSPRIVSSGRSAENDLGKLHDRAQKYERIEIDRGSISTINNGLISDRGPINAGSISGGFDAFMDQWEAVQEFYFDIHFSKKTTSSSSVLYEVFGLAICWQDSPVYYINVPKYLMSYSKPNSLEQNSKVTEIKSVSQNGVWELVRQRWNRIIKIMGKKGVRKITWNLKSQIHVLHAPRISIQKFGQIFGEHKVYNGFNLVGNALILIPVAVNDGIDMCLAVWMLWPDEESCSCPNLDKIVKKRLSTEAAAAAIRDGRWINQMQRAAHNGCCRRVSQTRALDHVLWRLLISENLAEPFIKIESPIVKVLYEMESWGIGVDLEACLQARQVLGKKLKELEKEAFRHAGMPFSLYSTADIANILYRHLKLPVPEVSSKKGKLHPSTDKHSLDLLRGQHPIIAVIKEHRTLSKLLNCTLGSICSKSQLCLDSQRYIIKGHWLQTSTATGRLSMEEPNLQCVEHTIEFTTLAKDDANVPDHHQINARDFFIPTQENWVLLTADYSQIELRLMAHFSGDVSLIELLSKPDGDVFTMLAAKWTGKQECTINSQEREHTKRLVYGILYGMSANTLAEHLECSQEEAGKKIRSFKASFPGVSAWLQDAVAFCCSKGYIQTLMGRKRFLSKIKCGDSKEKSKAQRQAINSICQGSAADIIKIAMINIHSVIIEGCELPAMAEIGIQCSRLKENCRFLLQVHDELLLEVDPNLAREAALLLQVCMESAASLSVPLRVKLKIGKTWGSLQPFDPKY